VLCRRARAADAKAISDVLLAACSPYEALYTTPFLKSACALYERHGFRRVAGDTTLHGTPLFAMVKPRHGP
jgi:hypothetical protein